ncbi:hypothetical protein FQV27_15340 [Paracoccus aurantiacus]|uniref:Uncharacterized protein n=1 Tax=Paracoccus aurantiacus TaxID=2599412 RepID=A0A5C6RYW9_9RHOB|nr:hypothetical protein FQV27_15340 [Paracoccus aurantiacus]
MEHHFVTVRIGQVRDIWIRQITELQVRVTVPNGYTALGIPVTEAVRQTRSGKKKPRPAADLYDRAAPLSVIIKFYHIPVHSRQKFAIAA